VPGLTAEATLTASTGDPEPLRNGLDRPIGNADDVGADNGWTGELGSWVQYAWETPRTASALRFVFDSDLNRPEHNMTYRYPLPFAPVRVPQTMVRAFRVETLGEDRTWAAVARVENNYQRLVRLDVDVETRALRFIPESTWGSPQAHLFAWDVASHPERVRS
jgi:hypothetical protein